MFTENELDILTNGLLAMIEDAATAEKLTRSAAALEAINEEIKSYKMLIDKISGMRAGN